MKLDINKIEDIMGKHGYIKVSLNRLPTWLNEKTKEGLQINEKNDIVTFVAERGERIFTKPDSVDMLEIKQEIYLSNNPKKSLETNISDTPAKDITSKEVKFVNQLSKVFAGEQIIVPENLKELQAMPILDRMLLFQKTDKQFSRKRKGFLLPASARKSKDSLTDSDYKWFTYVPANIMKMEANLAFGYLWGSEVQSEKWFDNEVVVRGFVIVTINGTVVRRPCGGSCIKKGNMDWGDALEGAISEMTKRGLYSLGFNADIKAGDFDEDRI